MLLKTKKFLCLLVFIPFHIAYAWDAANHEIVMAIAYMNLSQETKNAINQLLAKYPDKQFKKNHIYTAASFPDRLHTKNGKKLHRKWHHVNLTWRENEAYHPTFPNTANIVTVIPHAIAVLQDPKSSSKRKSFYLRYLIHLIGDIHQPLHASNRVDEKFPRGDRGGTLYFLNAHQNLHVLWDAGCRPSNDHIKLNDQYIDSIAKKIIDRYPRNYFANNEIQTQNAKIMAMESYQIARDDVYQFHHQPITKNYLHSCQRQSERRIALAGFRLAFILASLFDYRYDEAL